MTSIKRSALVPYTSFQMYSLVNDIENYPAFLPWCKSTTVHSRTNEEVKASVQIAKGALQHSFTTLNRLQPNKLIEMKLLEGPFQRLEGFWQFEELEEKGCQIVFDLEFQFSNKLLAMSIGPVLQKVAESFVEAFYQRAKDVYGPGK